MIIEVSFKGNRREFFHWPFEDAPAVKTAVVVEVERGEDVGRVHATGDLALKRKAGTTHGRATADPLRKVIRAASGEEISRAALLRADEYNVRMRAIEKVRALGLDLKVSDTEWQWDKKRLTIYFTAEQRVDFRNLVRQLEGLFGTRVHMWHIGVRDEAKRVDGVGRCGRQLCSASWLPELIPVKSSVAKDQHLSTLNPAQISGACGRLMCCLRYEHQFYVQQRKRFPKEGKIITTAAGEEKVVSLDIFRETVTLRSPVGESRVVPLVQLRQEMAGEPVTSVEDDHDADAAADVGADETVVRMPQPEPHERRPTQDQREQRPQREQRAPREHRPPRDNRPPPEQSAQGEKRPPRQHRPPRSEQRRPGPQPSAAKQANGAPPPDVGAETPAAGSSPDMEAPGSGRRRRGRRGGRRGNRGPQGQQGGQQGGREGPPAGSDSSGGLTGDTT